jgi:hypothetical protein
VLQFAQQCLTCPLLTNPLMQLHMLSTLSMHALQIQAFLCLLCVDCAHCGSVWSYCTAQYMWLSIVLMSASIHVRCSGLIVCVTCLLSVLQSGGVQLMDSAEAGKLLSGTGTARSPAAGSKLLPSQRPRLPSPPLPGTAAAPGAAAAAGPRVAVELKVTPEQTVVVTLSVIAPAGSRLPGLRRTGFGSSLGGRLGGASAGAGAGHSVGEAAAAPPQQPVVRKPRKRVSWKSHGELESVRWFVKEDPAVKVGSCPVLACGVQAGMGQR